jgi:hypothetical protein
MMSLRKKVMLTLVSCLIAGMSLGRAAHADTYRYTFRGGEVLEVEVVDGDEARGKRIASAVQNLTHVLAFEGETGEFTWEARDSRGRSPIATGEGEYTGRGESYEWQFEGEFAASTGDLKGASVEATLIYDEEEGRYVLDMTIDAPRAIVRIEQVLIPAGRTVDPD